MESDFKPIMWECMWERDIGEGDVIYFSNGDSHPHNYIHRVCIENQPPHHYVQAQIYQNLECKQGEGWFNVAQCRSASEARQIAQDLIKALSSQDERDRLREIATGEKATRSSIINQHEGALHKVYVVLMNHIEFENEDEDEDDGDKNDDDISEGFCEELSVEPIESPQKLDQLYVYEDREEALDCVMNLLTKNSGSISLGLDYVQQNILRRQLSETGRAFGPGGGMLYQLIERPIIFKVKGG